MKQMKQWMHWVLALVLLVIYAFATGIITYNSSRIDIWLDPFNAERGAGKDRLAAGALYGRAG